VLWNPSTVGEELFFLLYERLGMRLDLGEPYDDEDWLYARDRFLDFMRITATMEVLFRCIAEARTLQDEMGDPSADEHSRTLRRQLDLPQQLYADPKFGVLAKQSARIASANRQSRMLRHIPEPSNCYICGQPAVAPSADHVWPMALGGETSADNLIRACGQCNEKRDLMVTWASGPVQTTFCKKPAAGARMKPGLMLSLGFGRAMKYASGANPQARKLTLKQALQMAMPRHRDYGLTENKRYVYFELLKLVEDAA